MDTVNPVAGPSRGGGGRRKDRERERDGGRREEEEGGGEVRLCVGPCLLRLISAPAAAPPELPRFTH